MPIRAILTDIEGTTGSISFVRDVLFPYARDALPAFVRTNAHDAGVRRWLDAVREETGAADDEGAVAQLQAWIDEDRKHTALKALQGMVWEAGYRNGDFTAPVYPDAAAALREWHAAGFPISVYSSGSVPAQRLFFGHSDAGDLTPLVSGWFDTEIGGKRDSTSYTRIATALGQAPGDVLFLSDVVEELDAARVAGMQTVLVDRREDYPQPREGDAARGHRRVESFAAIGV